MFYGNSVKDTRKLFFSSWAKHLAKEPLLPIESQIVAVILDHPEYHALLEQYNAESEAAYYPELGQTNPFLHMGLHLAIRDQITTDRPQGIKALYQKLLPSYTSPLELEHALMDRLAEMLWLAQKNGSMPDESSYLASCKALLK